MKSIGTMYENALRNKARYPSSKGALSLEQLWDVPLRSKDGFDLNSVARTINTELRAASEESFVEASRNPAQGRLSEALEIVKYVIQTKLDEEDAAKDRAARVGERAKLLEALAKKQDAALDSLSEKEIKRRLEAIG